MKARIRIAQGRLDEASAWAVSATLSADDELSYLREFEHVTLARLLIARHGNSHGSAGDGRSMQDVVRFLERLGAAAQTGGRIGSVIELLVLQALAEQALGHTRSALDLCARALALGEPEGFLRVFLDEGTPMRDLMRSAVARGLAGEYARRVVATFDAPPVRRPTAPAASAPSVGAVHRATTDASRVVPPLTTRELEILRLVAAGLRNQQIADHLSISGATVKRHIANTYGKLGAGHRTEALLRETELKLL